jgi:hypothetical protein
LLATCAIIAVGGSLGLTRGTALFIEGVVKVGIGVKGYLVFIM